MLSHFAKYPFAEVEDALLPLLFSGEVDHANLLMLATALQGAPDLTPEQRLRVATLTGIAQECPPYTENKALWLETLAGGFANQAHELLEQQSEQTRLELGKDFDTLPLKSQLWLLTWQKEVDQGAFTDLLTRALAAETPLAEAALLKYEHDIPKDVTLERFRDSPNPDVRATALRADL